MTFLELQRAVFDDTQYQPSPKPGVQDRVRRWLNEGLERVLRRPRLKSLRFGTLPFTSQAGQGYFGFPEVFERVDYIVDLNNNRRLRFRTRDWYRNLDPSVMSSGTPSVWISEGIQSVARQPYPIRNGVWLCSTQAGDTTQVVTVRALRMLGDEVLTRVTLNGNTPIQIYVPGHQITFITGFSLDKPALGFVVLNDDTWVPPLTPDAAGANPWFNLATIHPPALSVRYLGIRLFPTPSAPVSYELEGQRVMPKMTYDEDQPPFPADFHEMLACYARARGYRKEGRLQQSQMEMQQFEQYAVELTAAIEYPSNYRPVAGKLSAEGNRWSDLGPDYPADRFGIISD
jgi:hypothetical protein